MILLTTKNLIGLKTPKISENLLNMKVAKKLKSIGLPRLADKVNYRVASQKTFSLLMCKSDSYFDEKKIFKLIWFKFNLCRAFT